MYRKWAQEEIDFLIKNWHQGEQYISKKLKRPFHSIDQKRRKLGLKLDDIKDRKGREWSEREELYVEEKLGVISIEDIAKKLGRSFNSVREKVVKMGLGDATLSFDGITINQLANAFNVSYCIVLNWVTQYGMPAYKKIFVKEMEVWVIGYEEFWKWAEKNKQTINFSRLEPFRLGPEPEWVKVKRDADKLNFEKKLKVAWSKEDINTLLGMVNSQKYTYPEIAERLKRSEAAIKRKLYDLGAKNPKQTKKRLWTPEQEQLIISMYNQGYGLNTIAQKVGKSALAVRGKFERLGYFFRNGVPIPPVNQYNS
jgi:hypothetical protein